MKNSWKAVKALTMALVATCAIPLCQGATITGLGTAANYGFLALPGSQVTMNAFTINGNVGLASGVTFTGANPNVISGNVYESSSGQFDNKGSHGSVVVAPATLAQNVTDASTAYTMDTGLTATQTFGSINSQTTINGDGGLNVIDINGDITKGLTLNGTDKDSFVVLVNGNLNLTTGDLGVSGGVSASNVLYIFTAAGDKINTMVPDKLYGTILAPNYSINMDSDLTGELIGGGAGDKITLMSVQTITAQTFCPPSAVPEPSTYYITGLGLTVLGALALFSRKRNSLQQTS
jgi:hypothetical protein